MAVVARRSFGIFDCQWRCEELFLWVSVSLAGGSMVRLRGAVFLAFVLVALGAGICPAAPRQSYDDLHAAVIIISDHSLGTFSKARSIVENAGARGLQMFPPETIFGLFLAISLDISQYRQKARRVDLSFTFNRAGDKKRVVIIR